MIEPIANGAFVRLRRKDGTVPPLLRGHYAEVLSGQRGTDGDWEYKVQVYAWLWKPILTMCGHLLIPVAPDSGARRIFLDRQDEHFAELDEAIEAFQGSLSRIAEALDLTKKQPLRTNLDPIWQAYNTYHAASLVGLDGWPKDRAAEIKAAWSALLRDSRDVTRWTELVVG